MEIKADATLPTSTPDLEGPTLQARLSASASEARTTMGWMMHDATTMAEQARLIAAASEELAVTA